MHPSDRRDPLFSAAVLKLSMVRKGMGDSPGFRVVYAGVLKELRLTDAAVEAYIFENRERLLAHLAGGAHED
jgi:hypothetical protein